MDFPWPDGATRRIPLPANFQRRRMNKVKVSAQALQLDRQILFEEKNKFAVIESPAAGDILHVRCNIHPARYFR